MIGAVMAYYGMSFTELKQLPLPAFWALIEQLSKLRAEDDLRFISAVSSAVWGSEEHMQSLIDTIKDSKDDDSDFDAEALAKMKRSLK